MGGTRRRGRRTPRYPAAVAARVAVIASKRARRSKSINHGHGNWRLPIRYIIMTPRYIPLSLYVCFGLFIYYFSSFQDRNEAENRFSSVTVCVFISSANTFLSLIIGEHSPDSVRSQMCFAPSTVVYLGPKYDFSVIRRRHKR